jgi:integrase
LTTPYLVMEKDTTLKRELTSEKDWLEDIFSQSNSQASKIRSETALRAFDVFCKSKLEIPDPDITDLELQRAEKLNQIKESFSIADRKTKQEIDGEFWKEVKARRQVVFLEARNQVIESYQQWFTQNPPDIQSICTSLQKWIRFCHTDHPEIIHHQQMKWKAKKGSTVKNYFATIKDYLRKCHGVRITTDDVKDYIKFPKDGKQLPEPLELEHIKLILAHADPRRKALYYLLLTSGMRLGEALSLKRSNFKIDVRPIKIHLHAKDTKTNEARDTYITEEAWEKVAPIFEARKEGEYLFHDYIFGEKRPNKYHVYPMPTPTPIYTAVITESRYFLRLRDAIGKKYNHKEPNVEFPQGTGILKHYEDSVRYCVHIHAMRSYFMSIATDVHNENYAHALSGHHAYLDQYIRKSEKQKAKMYLELEKHLLLESSKVYSEQFHEKEFDDLKEEMMQQKAEIEKLKREQSHRVDYDAESFGVTS